MLPRPARLCRPRRSPRPAHPRKPRLLDVGRRIPARDRFAPDSPLEEQGFEPLVLLLLFAGPGVAESRRSSGTPRATWQDSRDTSAVWAFAPSANQFVVPGAIPWLRLQVVGTQSGPTGGDRLTATTFIHRLETAGGIAPTTGCSAAAAVGKTALVSYEADYFFYRARPAHGQGHDDD